MKHAVLRKFNLSIIDFKDSAERLDLSYTDLQKVIEPYRTPNKSISGTVYIKNTDSNYKSICSLFNNLLNEANKNEN